MKALAIVFDEPICDFCSSPDVVFAYLVPDFILAAHHFGSGGMGTGSGSFAACSICMRLIESKQQAALEKRSFDSFIERYGRMIPDELTKEFIHDLHKEFWKWISLYK